jgi:arogenate dehydrogenase (NADP+)
MGVEYFRGDADAFCEEHPEVVVLATSILSAERVLRARQLLASVEKMISVLHHG